MISKRTHRPEEYTVSVRFEEYEGEWLFVARVAEVPDIIEFAEDAEFARTLALDSIETSQEVCKELGIDFPAPQVINNNQFSGRITLRLTKELHRLCFINSEVQGVTLNHYISSKLSESIGRENALSEVREQLNLLQESIQASTMQMHMINAYQLSQAQEESITYSRTTRANLTSGFSFDYESDLQSYMPAFIAKELTCR